MRMNAFSNHELRTKHHELYVYDETGRFHRDESDPFIGLRFECLP